MKISPRNSKKQLEEKIKALEAIIQVLEREKEDAQQMADISYECLEKMESKYRKSVQRELSYREMLFVFNQEKAENLLKSYISKEGLKIQFYKNYNYRSN